MPLTDSKIRNAKSTGKSYKLADANSLYLEITPSGSKLWRYRYRIGSHENIYAIGKYPTLTLADARAERDKAKKLVQQGIHPAHHRQLNVSHQIAENADTFMFIAREWIEYESPRKNWTSGYHAKITNTFESDVFPAIGSLPIRSILPAHILGILKKMEKRGAEVLAIVTRQWCSSVFRYAVSNLRADNDPTFVLKGAIKRPKVISNRPIPVQELPKFLKAIDNYTGQRSTVIAVKLLLLTFVRTKELREGVWDELDFKSRLWKIPAERMKMREPHTIPLSSQALDLFIELKRLTGGQKWLFPNARRPVDCMCPTTINRVLEYLGYGGIFSAHGFRGTASTILNDIGYRPDIIEKQLAHRDTNKVRAIYNRAEYLPERTVMLQQWADYLDELEAGVKKNMPCKINSLT